MHWHSRPIWFAPSPSSMQRHFWTHLVYVLLSRRLYIKRGSNRESMRRKAGLLFRALYPVESALSAEGNSFLGPTEWNAPFISLKAEARVPPAVSIMCEKVQLRERRMYRLLASWPTIMKAPVWNTILHTPALSAVWARAWSMKERERYPHSSQSKHTSTVYTRFSFEQKALAHDKSPHHQPYSTRHPFCHLPRAQMIIKRPKCLLLNKIMLFNNWIVSF